tara:strand:- start:276 stop:497 length:222 start_codon:yes stop_codon:yes gene_type:complete
MSLLPKTEQPEVCKRIMNIMNWIKSRIVEPTTWLAVGVGAVVLSMMIPAIAIVLWIIAIATVGAGIFMKEKGQ